MFDGDVTNSMIRRQPLLGDTEWREAQSLEVCQQLQGSATSDAIFTGSNNTTKLDFRAPASIPQTP